MAIDQLTDMIVDAYVTIPSPADRENFKAYVFEEFLKIEASLNQLAEAAPQAVDVAPSDPRKGMIRFALSPWDPGSGSDKFYGYNGSSWVTL